MYVVLGSFLSLRLKGNVNCHWFHVNTSLFERIIKIIQKIIIIWYDLMTYWQNKLGCEKIDAYVLHEGWKRVRHICLGLTFTI